MLVCWKFLGGRNFLQKTPGASACNVNFVAADTENIRIATSPQPNPKL